MHIAIDARIISSSTGRYVERLLTNLAEIDHDNTYTVLVRKKDVEYWKTSNPNFTTIVADFPDYSFAEQIGFCILLTKLKPDLVHFCMPQQPLFYIGKRVTTVHDLTLVRYENIDMNPVIYKVRKLIFTLLLKNVIHRSKYILSPTDYVRNDVLNFSTQKNAPKVIKTLEAWDPVADKLTPVKELEGKRFVFFVGNPFPYKNVRTIVDSFADLYEKRPDLHLGLAGKKDIFYEQIQQYAIDKGVADRVHILGFISEGEKRWMFRNGTAYIIASFSEGFHIPGLEAMSEDCPVISSNATCLPEVYENAALYFNPEKPAELTAAIEKIMDEKTTRRRLALAGKERLKAFSWKRMAKQTHKAYMNALKKSS